MNGIKTAGSMNLIFDEQKCATLDRYSVDFKRSNVAISYDDKKKVACVSVYHRETGDNRFYEVQEDGSLVLADTLEGDVLDGFN